MFRCSRAAALLALAFAAGDLPAQAEDRKLAADARAVLEKYCSRCHGDTKQSGDLDVRDHKTLVAPRGPEETYVVPKDPAKSYLWQRIDSGDMPPANAKQPTPADKAVLKKWVEAGAPEAVVKEAARPFVSPLEMLTAIRDDLEAAEDDDRPYLRYFTLSHLHNDPRLTAADLCLARAALSKALNSLTWKKAIVLPRAVDKSATVFAVDLRDLDWDRKGHERADRFDLLLAHYPYGLRYNEDRDEALGKIDRKVYDLAGKKLVYLRADWFVATATRPPLYHDILRLPKTAGELEARLGVDVAENFRRNRLARAGFASSGVSSQNRLVERHDALYGAYWKSYDFKKDAEKGKLTELPLGPDLSGAYRGKFPFADAAFAHAGGEVVFHLPNGLIGYFLLDGKDGRIDEGPTDIVSDKQETSGTTAIVTGLSCMACHSRGVVSNFKDEVRQGHALNGEGRLKVRRLYPPHETVVKRFLAEDEALFMAALEKTVGPFVAAPGGKDGLKKFLLTLKEPVGTAAVRYGRDLDLDDVAYELGYEKPADLRVLLGTPPLRALGLAGLLGGARLKRRDWDRTGGRSLFHRVAAAAEIGSASRTAK